MPSRRDLANAIRALSMDAVQKAQSGHPGAPMGMADIAQVLWSDYLKHNPSDPNWADRDRFVLSNGHASMLLYALLHLSGYDLPIEALKQFRQLHSPTPGHPEHGETPGVETTTGPLGQGLANAVGMALAERTLAATFNRPGFPIVDHATYVFMGDGCLMEGISHEVASFAGTLKLGKLVAFWDDNGISIDGPVAPWFAEDVAARFEAYGWHVVRGVDGHDAVSIAAAIDAAQRDDRPSLLCCRTVIGFGAPTVGGTEGCHGAPLGDAEIQKARAVLGWPYPPFEIPEAIQTAWDARAKGAAQQATWQDLFKKYAQAYPDLAVAFEARLRGDLPAAWTDHIKACRTLATLQRPLASRKASEMVLDYCAPMLPAFLGGSADLTGSNLTLWKGAVPISQDHAGNYLHYGVREFGMTAMMNGLALHGGFIPFGGTFLTFLDYARNAARMAAIMRLRMILVLTHDSIGLGEDGPTHQPVEHLASIRAMPGMHTWRPADSIETAAAWEHAVMRQGPTCLILSRQTLPFYTRTEAQLQDIDRGGYILRDCTGIPAVILIATGAEVALAVAAYEALPEMAIRVISMPCMEQFEAQPVAYRHAVLPPSIEARVAIEAAASQSWYRYVGLKGVVIGLDSFGGSAPAAQLFAHFGFTTENVIAAVQTLYAQMVE